MVENYHFFKKTGYLYQCMICKTHFSNSLSNAKAHAKLHGNIKIGLKNKSIPNPIWRNIEKINLADERRRMKKDEIALSRIMKERLRELCEEDELDDAIGHKCSTCGAEFLEEKYLKSHLCSKTAGPSKLFNK